MTSSYSYNISPAKVIRGKEAWLRSIEVVSNLCSKPILIGRSNATSELRFQLLNDLKGKGVKAVQALLRYDCCEHDLSWIQAKAIENSCDAIIAAGGGKVLDTGKLIGHRLNLPTITIPLSASTCAGWTALSNIYSKDGAFQKDVELDRCPELLIYDHSFIGLAPKRTLASGIADALAKWYESSVSSTNSKDIFVQQAVQMSRVLRDQLLIDSEKGFHNYYSQEWQRVIDSCSLTAGLIGGIGGSKCRTVAAHAIHNALTQIENSGKSLHGEKVGLGILVQLKLEETIGGSNLAKIASDQLIPLLKALQLPLSLDDLGLGNMSNEQLEYICKYACRSKSEIHYLPFRVTEKDLYNTLRYFDNGMKQDILFTNEIIKKN